jgi:prepilin-type N-terminal cleavage/methylation domain-containing protein
MIIMSKFRSSKGFTLIETLIAMSILCMIGVTFVALIMGSLRGWSSGAGQSYADTYATLAIQKLTQDIRVGMSAYVNSSNQLVVSIPPIVTDANGEKHYDTNSTPTIYTYYFYNGNLRRQIGSNSSTVFAKGISTDSGDNNSFSVTGGVVTVNIVTQEQVGTKKSKRCTTTKIVLRNYKS